VGEEHGFPLNVMEWRLIQPGASLLEQYP